MAKQLQHDTNPPGTPCRRCGIRYSPKNCYVPCFEENDTFKTWAARQHPEIVAEACANKGIPFSVQVQND